MSDSIRSAHVAERLRSTTSIATTEPTGRPTTTEPPATTAAPPPTTPATTAAPPTTSRPTVIELDGDSFGPKSGAFQQIWVRAADAAGWSMTSPLRRSAGYGEKGKGWRWTGAAQWSPHDLRHVAACWMLFDVGLDPAVVADKLGHADPAFTMNRYVGVRGDADVAATRLTEDW